MADAGAQTTTKVAGTIREGHYILIDNRPCKVLDVVAASNGRPNWCSFVGRDIFTLNERVSADFSLSDNVVVPIVNHNDYEVVHIDRTNVEVFYAAGEVKEFQVIDRTLLNRIRARLDDDRKLDRELSRRSLVATVLSAMGEERISAFKAINPIYP
ncbi:eukaryotic elongation factor 5A-1 [Artemisia annua]|uniref:Eukaryotic elongation factor 5A-1 n=1 Tax=Artemisia annua TaxID=35608 RepID=A0A2U1PUG6_ARTAN|nr:eukaryotic elongation factor 5A-1 [Artemisia annua]